MTHIRQPGIAPKALNQARETLPPVAVAFRAADLKKMKGAFEVPESA